MLGDNGLPSVGNQSNQLGVRTEPSRHADVHPKWLPNGDVGPGEGMSVAPHWTALHPLHIPKRLRKYHADARGRDELIIWRHGDGSFCDAAINDDLTLGSVTRQHGQVEPARIMPLARFQEALASTRGDWTRDEEG
jgi:hypothetical protein